MGVTKNNCQCKRIIKTGNYCHSHKAVANTEQVHNLLVDKSEFIETHKNKVNNNKKNMKLNNITRKYEKTINTMKKQNEAIRFANDKLHKDYSMMKAAYNEMKRERDELNDVMEQYHTTVEYNKLKSDLCKMLNVKDICNGLLYANKQLITNKYKKDINVFISEYHNMRIARNVFCHRGDTTNQPIKYISL